MLQHLPKVNLYQYDRYIFKRWEKILLAKKVWNFSFLAQLKNFFIWKQLKLITMLSVERFYKSCISEKSYLLQDYCMHIIYRDILFEMTQIQVFIYETAK